MARPRACFAFFISESGAHMKIYWRVLILLSALFLAIVELPVAHSQTQQPFLIAVQTAGTQFGSVTFVRDDTTGALTLLPASQVNFSKPCSPNAIEPKDRFLFGACGDGLSMYSLDGSSGIVSEVAASPFAASIGNLAELIVTESTGQYVYLLKTISSGSTSTNSLILDTFQIDPQAVDLVPASSQTLPVAGYPVGAVSDPNGHGFTVFLNQDQGGAQPVPVLYTVTFDPSTGLALIPSSGTNVPGLDAQSIQIGPKGNFMSFNFGQNSEFLTIDQLSTTNFQPLTSNTLNIGSVPFAPRGIFFDPTDTLIYVQSLNTGPGEYTNFQVFDLGTLSEIPSSPLSFDVAQYAGCGLQNPYAPFVYCEYFSGAGGPPTGLSVYQVNPISGIPGQPSPINLPFAANLAISPALLTTTASQQNSTTPALAWSPAGLVFTSTQTGQSSPPQFLTIKNIGTLPATFSSVAISGPNASDFSKADLCTPGVILQPSSTCTISITFSPSSAGSSQATLAVYDNASGSPQTISLSGTAVSPPPAVSLSPSGTFTFPGTTTQGTTGAPQNITLTNTGNGSLHVSNIVLNGFDANDFLLGASSCLGTVSPAAHCLIPISFAPLAAGIRTATLNISDDAADSPQTIALNATASPAVTLGPAPSGSTSAAVSPGQTAQFSLQITPGAGYTGAVSLSCGGTPQGATCQLPSTLQLTNGNAAPFSVAVTTTGGAGGVLPLSNIPRAMPICGLRAAPTLTLGILLLLLLVLVAGTRRDSTPHSGRFAFAGALSTIALLTMSFVMLGAAGCGGGSQAITTPPPIVTPQGTFNMMVTPAAKAANGQPLQLQPIQLTLTVK